MSKRSLVGFLALALCLAIAAGAVAAGSDFSSLSKRSASKPLADPGQTAKVAVACKGDKSPVSGGFDIGRVGFTHGPVMTSSRAKGSGWASSANEFANDPGESDELTGDVNCASKAPGISVKSARATLAPGQVKTVKAWCGTGGKHAIAGGFKTRYNGGVPNVSGVIVSSSYLSDGQTWKVRASAIPSSTPQERSGRRSAGSARGASTPLKVYVYCADVPALKVSSKTTAGSSDRVHPKATAKCSKHRKVVSGGFKSALDQGGNFTEANLPELSGLKGKRSWTTRAYFFPLFSNNQLKWTAYAYCA